jgi:hypothetical protein
MDSISSAELIELILLQRQGFDAQFQFWITATFAVIIASFATANRLGVRYRVAIAVLYILTTFMLFARWGSDGQEIVILYSEIKTRGIPYSGPRVFAVTKFVVVIFGTVTALVFLYHDAKNDRDDDT